jgi:hypothetical protein
MQATTERRPGQLRTRSNPTDGIVAAKQILSFWRYEPTASSEQGGTMQMGKGSLGTSGASTPLSDGNLLRSLRARSAWQWTKAFLVKKDLKPGTGYPAIEAALAANNKYGQNLRVALQEFYESIRFAGRKYVQIFEIPSNISDVLKPILNEAQVQPSKFSEFFPYVLPDTALGSAPPTITLCEVTKSASGDYTLVYCSRKDYTERDIFENAAATELGKLAPALVGYGKIVGLKPGVFRRSIWLSFGPDFGDWKYWWTCRLATFKISTRLNKQPTYCALSNFTFHNSRNTLQGSFQIIFLQPSMKYTRTLTADNCRKFA